MIIFNRYSKIKYIFLDKKLNPEDMLIRNKAFEHFNKDLIPHSTEVYNIDNLSNSQDQYDVFLVGSDPCVLG